jgi:hypothetical protein
MFPLETWSGFVGVGAAPVTHSRYLARGDYYWFFGFGAEAKRSGAGFLLTLF